mgnify:CR=1 FL=1
MRMIPHAGSIDTSTQQLCDCIMVVEPCGADVAAETTLGIEYKIAETRQEREAAFRLVYDSYLRSGLSEPNPWQMRVTPYHLLPTTQVLIAKQGDQVIFTASLVADGELGLPMECVYSEELDVCRARGLWLAEVSCLADRRQHLRGFFPVFLRLSRLLVQFAMYQGMDGLVAAVHPKHARFYKRYMCFLPMGQQKSYPTVRHRPAVALWLEFSRFHSELRCHPNYEVFFGEQLPEQQLQPCFMSQAEREYFGRMIDPSFKLAPLGSGELDFGPMVGEPASHVA